MNNNLAKIDQFKGVLNSQTIRAQLKNSLKDKAGAVYEQHDRPVFRRNGAPEL